MINTNFSTHSNDSINYLVNTNNLLINNKNSLNYINNLNKKIFSTITLSLSELNIIKSLEDFYNNKINYNILLQIINTDTFISIRLINYFITKYSKFNKINIKLFNNYTKKDDTLNIYISYKQQLKIYQKKYFDPFSRGDRIPYCIGDTCIITTIGQLNFFKWFISKNIYNFMLLNKISIEYDMNFNNKINKFKIKKDKQKNIKKNKINKTVNTVTYNNLNNSINSINCINNILVTFK
jgi:hypothetical protein